MIELHDHVEKVGGDYTFVGTVVAKFTKLSGLIRFVVEDDCGALHVYSEKNLRKINVVDNNVHKCTDWPNLENIKIIKED